MKATSKDSDEKRREREEDIKATLRLEAQLNEYFKNDVWKNINTMPKDGTVIQRWHKAWKCPVSVKHNNNTLPSALEWIEGTLATSWPEEAFEPFWMPLPKAPASNK